SAGGGNEPQPRRRSEGRALSRGPLLPPLRGEGGVASAARSTARDCFAGADVFKRGTCAAGPTARDAFSVGSDGARPPRVARQCPRAEEHDGAPGGDGR